MPMRSARSALLALAALTAALLAPAGVLAADVVTVTGTVVHGGAPVTGVEIVVSVTGSDQILSATTDEAGAFSIQVEGGGDTVLQVYATGQTSRSDPDVAGCVTSETPVGSLSVTIEALPPPPLVVPLDEVITGTVCSATARPEVTPPATDTVRAGPVRSSGGGTPAILAGLALLVAGSLSLARRRA